MSNIELTDLNSARGRLQQASAKLFKEKGFSKTTVRDIAASVGIQSGSIFHHFQNKEQILKTVIIDAIMRVLAPMREILSSSDNIEEKFKLLIQCELNAIHDETLDGFRLMVSEWRSLNSENRDEILILRDEYEKIWLEILSLAFRKGLVNIEGFYLRGFIRGALIETSNWYNPDGDLNLDDLAIKLSSAFINKSA
jgi:AcrR family transcriptional regulator